jgi:hypothetical protein
MVEAEVEEVLILAYIAGVREVVKLVLLVLEMMVGQEQVEARLPWEPVVALFQQAVVAMQPVAELVV